MRKLTVASLSAMILAVLFAGQTLAQLSPDASFGGDGKVSLGFRPGTLQDVAIQPDNKILFAAPCNDIGSPVPFCIARATENGAFDTTFNNTGFVMFTPPGSFGTVEKEGLAVQSDGKILVAGSSSSAGFLIRLNSDASFDTTFGTNGVTTAAGLINANDVILQPDGKSIVVGYSGTSPRKLTIARHLSTGALDTSFGIAGVTKIDLAGLGGIGIYVTLQSNGKILCGGYATSGDPNVTAWEVIVRLNRDGTPDASFDADGIATITNLGGGLKRIVYVSTQFDDKIVAFSDANVIYRFNSDGSLDPTFDGDGSRTAIDGAEAYGAFVTASGRIIVGGNHIPTGSSGYQWVNYLTRVYLPDGSPDPNFVVPEVDIDTTTDGVTVARIDRQGRLLVAGRSSVGPRFAPWYLPSFSAARFTAPPVQNVEILGRVANLSGKRVSNAFLTLFDGATAVASTRTNTQGYFRFGNVPTNKTYTIKTTVKGLTFYDREVTVDNAIPGMVIFGE